jgi:hypothetical protein
MLDPSRSLMRKGGSKPRESQQFDQRALTLTLPFGWQKQLL